MPYSKAFVKCFVIDTGITITFNACYAYSKVYLTNWLL